MTNWRLNFKGSDYALYECKTSKAIITYVDINFGTGIVSIYSKVTGEDGYIYDVPVTRLSPEDIEYIASKTKELIKWKK